MELHRSKQPEVKIEVLYKTVDKYIENIGKGSIHKYLLLDKFDDFTSEFNIEDTTSFVMRHQIVDFSAIHTVPLDILQKDVAKTPKRLRLLPPYRGNMFLKHWLNIICV